MCIRDSVQIVGSLLLGAAIGFAQTLAARFFHSRGNMLALAIASVLAGLALCEMWNLSSLLVCMMIGAVMINVSPASSKIIEQCDRFTPPLFMLFFVLSGADLDLSVLPTVGLLGISYLIFRSAGKYFGAHFSAKAVGCDEKTVKYLGITLLPQAGVALGMSVTVAAEFGAAGALIRNIVLFSVLIYELVGPLLTKLALTAAGEIIPEGRTNARMANKPEFPVSLD